MTKRLNTSKGITLIALVITIIVLLILAGVAISMLSGENGILKQATEAKVQTEEKSTIEKIQLAATAAITNTEHKIENKDKLIEALKQQGLNVSDEYVTEDQDTGYKVTVDGVTKIVSPNGIVSDYVVAPKIITFTISSETYQAEEGMTWEEWINSTYNEGEKFFARGSYVGVGDFGTDLFVILNSGVKVNVDDIIIDSESYSVKHDGGSAN